MTDLDLSSGHVFVRQDWCYRWMAAAPFQPWTSEQRFDFHHKVDHAIWARWSLKARVKVQPATNRRHDLGTIPNDILDRFRAHGLTLSFDVRSVIGRAHWQTNVRKADASLHPRPQASCNFETRTLDLHDTDLDLHEASRFANDLRKQKGFSVIAHEFGHAIGYANPRGFDDEYKGHSKFREDVHSIMNVGKQIRVRHLGLITETLAKMVPACSFQAVLEMA